jgi:hypothetical protein
MEPTRVALKHHAPVSLTEEARELLCSASATLDRPLALERSRLRFKGRDLTRSGGPRGRAKEALSWTPAGRRETRRPMSLPHHVEAGATPTQDWGLSSTREDLDRTRGADGIDLRSDSPT